MLQILLNLLENRSEYEPGSSELPDASNPIEFIRESYRIEAQRYVRDMKLAEHVHRRNQDKGLTVPSASLSAIGDNLHELAVERSAIAPLVDSSLRARVQWGHRWRARASEGKLTALVPERN